MSDTKVNYEKLPWGECKPYDGVSVFYRMDTIVVTSRGGDLLIRNKCDNSKTWVIGDSVASFSFDWLNLIKENVDAWIDSELEKLKEKERVEAAKVAHPVPPDGYRLCSKEEAKNTPSGLAFFWVDMDTGNGAYCTSAPRKFVRCTPADASLLFKSGAYLNWRDRGTIEWLGLHFSKTWPTCEYRVDRYTIPEGFKLQPIMPTVRLPEGHKWGVEGGLGPNLLNEFCYVPRNNELYSKLVNKVKLFQAIIAGYDEIHDGET